jgi:hypothetical protein
VRFRCARAGSESPDSTSRHRLIVKKADDGRATRCIEPRSRLSQRGVASTVRRKPAAIAGYSLSPLCYYRRDFAEPGLAGFSRFTATTPALIRRVIDAIAGKTRR